jgi:hypothetical protein
MTPLEKLECMIDCFKKITHVLALTSPKDESAGADECLPL